MKIYDGEGLLLGRLCSVVAKKSLLGEEIVIVNCDKVIISGGKRQVFANEKQKQERRGYPLKSAKRPRMSDRFVRRRVRGMLPWSQTRGKEAFKRVMCYTGVPEEFQGKDLLTIEAASMKKLPNLKFVTVNEVVKNLGGKQWKLHQFSSMKTKRHSYNEKNNP